MTKKKRLDKALSRIAELRKENIFLKNLLETKDLIGVSDSKINEKSSAFILLQNVFKDRFNNLTNEKLEEICYLLTTKQRIAEGFEFDKTIEHLPKNEQLVQHWNRKQKGDISKIEKEALIRINGGILPNGFELHPDFESKFLNPTALDYYQADNYGVYNPETYDVEYVKSDEYYSFRRTFNEYVVIFYLIYRPDEYDEVITQLDNLINEKEAA